MVRRCLAIAAVAVCSSAAATLSTAWADPRGVVELFTSQGCSSCPAADRLLGKLAADPSLVAITLSVNYWDYLGWKDTLASPRNSARQLGYMKARGDRERYTPQAVVNGAVHALGSSREAIESAIAKSRQSRVVLSVPVKCVPAGDDVSVTISGAPNADTGAEVWVVGLARAVSVKITRGENRGKTITYHNVARSWTKLGIWKGRGSNWTFPVSQIRRDGVDAAAILLQGGTVEKPGKLLGAAIASLR